MNRFLEIGIFLFLLLWITFVCVFYILPDSSSISKVKVSPDSDIDISVDLPTENRPRRTEILKETFINLLDDENSINPINLTCKPESFGYTMEEALLLFPNVTYPRCEEKYKSSPEMFYIDRTTNTLHMNCTGRVALGALENNEEFGKYRYYNRLKDYNGEPLVLESEEYAFGTCDRYKTSGFEHVAYKLKLNEGSLQRAKNSLHGKPINIVMLVIDSLSRRMFFRKLPKSVEYLNSIAKNVSIFDFKLHHVIGQNSQYSFMPTFYGDIAIVISSHMSYGDLYYDISIWKYLHERGFVTMMGMDNCDDNLPQFIGRKPRVDHKMGSLWCAASSQYGYSETLKKERCIGNKNAHAWMMDYILDFSETYKNVSRYTYMHIDTAHEATGTVVSTIDLDLKDFLEEFFNRDEDSILFLMGDHGMRYGEWFKTIDGSHEHKLPLLLILTKDRVLEKISNSSKFLLQNTNRLLSKFDFHTVLQHLGNYPDLESHKDEIRKKTSSKLTTYNWFTDYIPENRTCEDAGIPVYWCGCQPFIEITENQNSEEFTYLTNNIIEVFNTENNIYDHSKKTICQKLHLNNNTYIGKLVDGDLDYYKIKFTVQEKESALLEVIVRLSRWRIEKEESEYFEVKNIGFRGMRYYNIMNINRLDSYESVCKNEIIKNKFDPTYCICDEDDFNRKSNSTDNDNNPGALNHNN
ncbi:unnamed protein product [Blepharisma stoltei]|uniref:Uncharacterized protein n=1 Tax=Blepharisma stoltei TaxID=1481888 RepID=A0AAU9JM40_9CILI|nr:unnamed protein product [Blepharisma stoltei]